MGVVYSVDGVMNWALSTCGPTVPPGGSGRMYDQEPAQASGRFEDWLADEVAQAKQGERRGLVDPARSLHASATVELRQHFGCRRLGCVETGLPRRPAATLADRVMLGLSHAVRRRPRMRPALAERPTDRRRGPHHDAELGPSVRQPPGVPESSPARRPGPRQVPPGSRSRSRSGTALSTRSSSYQHAAAHRRAPPLGRPLGGGDRGRARDRPGHREEPLVTGPGAPAGRAHAESVAAVSPARRRRRTGRRTAGPRRASRSPRRRRR